MPLGFLENKAGSCQWQQRSPQELCCVLRSAQGPGVRALLAPEQRGTGQPLLTSSQLFQWALKAQNPSFCRVPSCSRKETWTPTGAVCCCSPTPRSRLYREGPSFNTLSPAQAEHKRPALLPGSGTPERASFCGLHPCIPSTLPPLSRAAHSTLCLLQGARPQQKDSEPSVTGLRLPEAGKLPTAVIATDVDTRVALLAGTAWGGKNPTALNKDTAFSLLYRLSALFCLHN